MKKSFLFCLFTGIFSLNTFANPDYYLEKEFKSIFSAQYTEGRCGDNILGLLSRAETKGIKIESARILEITNKGFSLFGLINAEFARQSNRAPSEKNWYHHVVLEQDGYIFDFDFGNMPTIGTVKEYFEKMFLNDVKKEHGHYVGREEKLKTYEILERPAYETIIARRNKKAAPELRKVRLVNYLQDF
jgi:hypothetical protein